MFHYQSPNKEVYVSAGVHLLICLQNTLKRGGLILMKLSGNDNITGNTRLLKFGDNPYQLLDPGIF